jgi:multidrug resistance efflux pump
MPGMRRGGRPGLVGMAARTAVVAGTATAVSGNVSRRQQDRQNAEYEQQQYEMQQQQAQSNQAMPAASAAEGGDIAGDIQRLVALYQQGVLSDQEFAAAKAKLLG